MLQVLWIVNILFPEASEILGRKRPLKSSGGWLIGAANALSSNKNVKLVVATPSSMVNKLEYLRGNNIEYYIFPIGKGNLKRNDSYRTYWRTIHDSIRPDVVHIHGTEMSHGLAYIEECGSDNVVVSIQGLISVISEYYNSGLTKWDIISHITVRDLIRNTLFGQQHKFRRRGVLEKELLSKVSYVIGRTSWDYAHIKALNPHSKYFVCNEILRHEFYVAKEWCYEQCRPHSIFISQSSYPLKGLHMVLRAMPFVLREYPDTIIRVAGGDITQRNNSIFKQIMRTGYGSIILSEIKKLGLNEKVTFVGNLDANGMINEFLSSNLFIIPSSLENSPNSLGEAQLLGVPVLASYVGGVPDMMTGNEENLYRFEEIEMLACKICKIFDAGNKQVSSRDLALLRHDAQLNTTRLLEIYRTVEG